MSPVIVPLGMTTVDVPAFLRRNSFVINADKPAAISDPFSAMPYGGGSFIAY